MDPVVLVDHFDQMVLPDLNLLLVLEGQMIQLHLVVLQVQVVLYCQWNQKDLASQMHQEHQVVQTTRSALMGLLAQVDPMDLVDL